MPEQLRGVAADQSGAPGAHAQPQASPQDRRSASPGVSALTPPPPAPFDILSVLSSANESCYIWSMTTDDMVWAGNALEILKSPNPADLAKGRSYQLLLEAEFAEARFQALADAASSDMGEGGPYWIQYRFKPKGRRSGESLWIEDIGRCFVGPGGKPDRVRGTVRVINERYEREQKLLFLSAHDELTGHMNRNSLTEALANYLETSTSKRT
ncbi:MAG: hypothetical protein VX871_03265, partial [Pseudomonadota bacterium]|nr:hypothetical protein [Pseudomonadota bacterium]